MPKEKIDFHWDGDVLCLSSAEGLEWHGTVPDVAGKITSDTLGQVLIYIAQTRPEMFKNAKVLS